VPKRGPSAVDHASNSAELPWDLLVMENLPEAPQARILHANNADELQAATISRTKADDLAGNSSGGSRPRSRSEGP
jgi:hypothetical protein